MNSGVSRSRENIELGPGHLQPRAVGLNGTHFHMLKFRLMKIDADEEVRALLPQQSTDGQALFKRLNDPRLPRIGGTLRK